jgi:sodium transport system permease protein
MRTVLTVFRKEVLDSLRDRRTLMSALLMGPLFGPIIFVFMINLSLEQAISDDEKALDVPAIGMSHAPNLVAYLESNNLRVVDLPDSRNAAVESVEQGRKDFVLIIPKDFGDRLRQSLPARVEIISDRANTTAERDAGRLRDALER